MISSVCFTRDVYFINTVFEQHIIFVMQQNKFAFSQTTQNLGTLPRKHFHEYKKSTEVHRTLNNSSKYVIVCMRSKQ